MEPRIRTNSTQTSSGQGVPRENAASGPDSESGRRCWICLGHEEAHWVHPCKCRGTLKWAHHCCLQRLVVQQATIGVRDPFCPQCKQQYTVLLPKLPGYTWNFLMMNTWINQMMVYMQNIVIFIAYYWLGLTYGAITVLEVLGRERCLAFLKESDWLKSRIGVGLLPVIPAVLILGRHHVCWDTVLLSYVRNNFTKIPIIRRFPSLRPYIATNMEGVDDYPPIYILTPLKRVVFGALALPFISLYLGKFLFGFVESDIYKTILGGLVFIALKGFVNMYRYQQAYILMNGRKVLDYNSDSNMDNNEGNQEVD